MSDKRQCILIEWADIQTDHGWTEELSPPARVLSVGFLVQEDEDTLWLAADCSADLDDKEMNRVMSIPKGCIRQRRKLALPKKL